MSGAIIAATLLTTVNTAPVVTLSTAVAYGSVYGGGTATTEVVTTSIAGGRAPFTYSWTFVSGSATVNVTASTASSTSFYGTIAYGGQAFAVWRCTITDASGQTSHADVDVFLQDPSLEIIF